MIKKRLFFLLLFVVLVSCNPREDIVTFYLDNEISQELNLNSEVSDNNVIVFSQETLSLLDSETFKKYILNMIELEATEIKLTISDFNNGVINPTLKIGNSIMIQNSPFVNGTFKIQEEQLLNKISSELMNYKTIPFSFEGESVAEDSFTVSVQISLKGVFTD